MLKIALEIGKHMMYQNDYAEYNRLLFLVEFEGRVTLGIININ